LDRVEACREPSQGLWLFFKSFLSISWNNHFHSPDSTTKTSTHIWTYI
jgi:hypothetical protein